MNRTALNFSQNRLSVAQAVRICRKTKVWVFETENCFHLEMLVGGKFGAWVTCSLFWQRANQSLWPQESCQWQGKKRYEATQLDPQAVAVTSCRNWNTLVSHHCWPKRSNWHGDIYFVKASSQNLSAPPWKTISSKYFLRLSNFNSIPLDTIYIPFAWKQTSFQ